MGKKITEKLLEPIRAITELFNHSSVDGVIIGGIAASILGKPRFTADVDAVVILSETPLEKFLEYAKKLQLFPRINEALSFASKNRILLLTHRPSGLGVDISLGILPFEKDMIERAKRIKIDDISFKIPTPEDLIIMKGISHREQDLIDIDWIIKLNPKLDFRRVRKLLKDFSKVLEMPEILKDVEKIISKHMIKK
ncbi:MAG TPA: nucleotidyltransferase [bacterium]